MEKISVFQTLKDLKCVYKVLVRDNLNPFDPPYAIYIGVITKDEYILITGDGTICEKGNSHKGLYKYVFKRLINDGVFLSPSVQMDILTEGSLYFELNNLYTYEQTYKKEVK